MTQLADSGAGSDGGRGGGNQRSGVEQEPVTSRQSELQIRSIKTYSVNRSGRVNPQLLATQGETRPANTEYTQPWRRNRVEYRTENTCPAIAKLNIQKKTEETAKRGGVRGTNSQMACARGLHERQLTLEPSLCTPYGGRFPVNTPPCKTRRVTPGLPL